MTEPGLQFIWRNNLKIFNKCSRFDSLHVITQNIYSKFKVLTLYKKTHNIP